MQWARQATEEDWTYTELQQRIHAAGEGRPLKLRRCVVCREAGELRGQGVDFEFGRSERVWCCGIGCATEYLKRRHEVTERACSGQGGSS